MPSVTDQGIVGYMCDNGNDYPFTMNSMRIIIGSCPHMDNYFNSGHEKDDAWLILPGYKVVLYRYTNYSGAVPSTLDNTEGEYPKMFVLLSRANKTKSFKAYYKGGDALPEIGSHHNWDMTLVGPSD